MDGRHFPPGKISLKMSLRSENVNSASNLRVKVENQSSKTPADKPSSGYHATAWFEHSSSDDKYEYAIYVKNIVASKICQRCLEISGDSYHKKSIHGFETGRRSACGEI